MMNAIQELIAVAQDILDSEHKLYGRELSKDERRTLNLTRTALYQRLDAAVIAARKSPRGDVPAMKWLGAVNAVGETCGRVLFPPEWSPRVGLVSIGESSVSLSGQSREAWYYETVMQPAQDARNKLLELSQLIRPEAPSDVDPQDPAEPKLEGERTAPATVNVRMIDIMLRNPEARGWTCRQWARELKCSPSSVAEAETWKELDLLRAQLRASSRRDRRRR